MMSNIILSICIPTYNRSSFLRRLVDSLLTQIGEFSNSIEIIISDNASTDGTHDYCNKLVNDFCQITYVRSKLNLGPDENISKVFKMAIGKYVWVLGDDEVLGYSAIKTIMGFLSEKESYDLIYLKSVSTTERKKNRVKQISFKNYKSKKHFLKKVEIHFTFISGIIIKKDVVKLPDLIESYKGSYLVQLAWVFQGIQNGKEFLYINTPLVMSEPNNSGGYNVHEVFIRNFIEISKDFFFDNKPFFLLLKKASLMFNFKLYIHKMNHVENNVGQDCLDIFDAYFRDLFVYKFYLRNILITQNDFVVKLLWLPYRVCYKFLRVINSK